jgi:hypothetical protein
MLKTLDKWHRTSGGYLLFALVELAISYLFISLAIDRGNLLYYLLSLLFLIGSLQNFFKLIGGLTRGRYNRPSSAARRR